MHPTRFPELNAVLAELVDGARRVLEENFCAAYLHGSFATGDADEFSDVDFVIVSHDEVTAEQQRETARVFAPRAQADGADATSRRV